MAAVFVVTTARRTHIHDSADVTVDFPVVVEDDQGHVTGPVAVRDTRVQAQTLADALNAALTAN